MVKSQHEILSKGFSLGFDWLFSQVEKAPDTVSFISALGSIYNARGDRPTIDFLEIDSLAFDLEMKTETELNLLELEYSGQQISPSEYRSKAETIKSKPHQDLLKRELLDECWRLVHEPLIVAAEVLLSLLNKDRKLLEFLIKELQFSDDERKLQSQLETFWADAETYEPQIKNHLSVIFEYCQIILNTTTDKPWCRATCLQAHKKLLQKLSAFSTAFFDEKSLKVVRS